jgi:hypothetical protein
MAGKSDFKDCNNVYIRISTKKGDSNEPPWKKHPDIVT